MEPTNFNIRDYHSHDYSQCETLVSNAWEFDKNFTPQGMADIAKRMYTMGSVINSNFFKVVEVESKVIGFLFGLNANTEQPKKSTVIVFGLKLLKNILFLKGSHFKDKKRFIKAVNTHSVNRYKLVKTGVSEIVLFVVDPAYQGKGLGKKLLSEFVSHCKTSNVDKIIVETNTQGASTFYEGLGFRLIGYFDSPLHRYAAKEGQACMYKLHIA